MLYFLPSLCFGEATSDFSECGGGVVALNFTVHHLMQSYLVTWYVMLVPLRTNNFISYGRGVLRHYVAFTFDML